MFRFVPFQLGVGLAILAGYMLLTGLGVGAFEAPPARYDHPLHVAVKVIEGDRDQVNRVCRMASRYHGEYGILSCALPSADLCIIVWPKGEPRSGPLWRHEQAHCNGWQH